MRVVILYNLDDRLISGEYGKALAELSLNEEISVVERALRFLGHEYRTIAIPDAVDIVAIANLIRGLKPDVVFNLVEGVYKNSRLEMCVPALLELMKIPYTGSNALTLGLCQDKAKSKAVLKASGIKTPFFEVFESVSPETNMNGFFPLIVKPIHEDGSLGIDKDSVVNDNAALQDAIYKILIGYRQPAIVEQYIDGREFGVGVIDFNGGPEPFPVSEIVFDGYPQGVPRIVTYNAKWNNETTEFKESVPHCPAELDWYMSDHLQRLGLMAFKALGCRGYARIDMRLKDETFAYVIEVNPNPDIAPGSGIFNVLNAAGVEYHVFVKNLIEGALKNARK